MVAGELPGGREQIRTLGWELENSRAELILVSQLTDDRGPRLHLRPVEGLPWSMWTLPQYSGVSTRSNGCSTLSCRQPRCWYLQFPWPSWRWL